MDKHEPSNDELGRFRAETEELQGVKKGSHEYARSPRQIGPRLTGLQRINIHWKAQGSRFSRPEALGCATDSRQMVTINRWIFSFRYPKATPPASEQQTQHSSVVPPI